MGAGLHSTVTLPAAGGTLGRFFPLASGGVRYAVDDFWELGGFASAGVGVGGGLRPEGLAQLAFEARYVIDALTWVPYLCAGVGGLLRSDGPGAYDGLAAGPAIDLTAHAGFGVEYRPSRDWSVGAVARYHFALTDLARTIGPIDFVISVSFYRD